MAEDSVQIKTADGVADAMVFYPDGAGAWPAVLFYMDAPGIRPAFHDLGRRLAANGYVALLPNLYYRGGAAGHYDPAVAQTDEARALRQEKMKALTPEAMQRDTASYLDFLGGHKAGNKAQAGCVGYCMGGSMSLRTAGNFPDRIGAAASYHGGRLATELPESPHLLAPKMRAKIYAGMAIDDASMTPEMAGRLEVALSESKVGHQLELYDNCKHGWTIKGNAVYNETGAERHWETMLSLFGSTLKA